MFYNRLAGHEPITALLVVRHLSLAVAALGIGIPETEQARILARFYRVAMPRSRHNGGLGLGLAIVRALEHAMDGQVAVSSLLGVGSTLLEPLPVSCRQQLHSSDITRTLLFNDKHITTQLFASLELAMEDFVSKKLSPCFRSYFWRC